jgi:hypothetical protein
MNMLPALFGSLFSRFTTAEAVSGKADELSGEIKYLHKKRISTSRDNIPELSIHLVTIYYGDVQLTILHISN